MKKDKDIELIKDWIMKELFIDINNHCIIDMYLNDDKSNLMCNFSISNISMIFLESERGKLLSEYNKGQILFFRKYSYEKILNDYLARLYNVEFAEMNMFPSEEKVKELEKTRLEQERLEKRKMVERYILNHITEYQWEKTVKVSRIIYKTKDDDNRIIELQITDKSKKETGEASAYNLKYDNKAFVLDYDGRKLVQEIQNTHPKKNKVDSIIVVTKPQNSKFGKPRTVPVQEREVEKKSNIRTETKGYILDLVKEYDLKIDKVKNLVGFSQNRCQYHGSGKFCKYFNDICSISPECICYNDFITRIKKESRKGKSNKKVPQAVAKVIPSETVLFTDYIKEISNKKKQNEKELPQIGIKDFVVRGNVFLCMHSGHKIDNINAMINIIDADDKKQSVKIAAGYCNQCNVYFIMDSTYQKIRNKGIILCRVSDEKTYLKNGYINGMQLAQESILMQYGYNVSQVEGLSATRRQKILAVIIDNKIMSKSEIISYLDFFISQRSSRNNMEIAISKWETDREFVENYKMGEYTQFGVRAIYRR